MTQAQSESFGPHVVVVDPPVSFGPPPVPDERPPALRSAYDRDVEVRGQVFRPASPEYGGPLPVVLFLHGFAGQPAAYGVLLYHLASWGFLCVAVEDRTIATRVNPHTQALLAWSLARHVLDSDESEDLLGAPVSASGWAVVGHSMGAVGAFYLGAAEPRVETIVSIAPYDGNVSALGGSCGQVPAGLLHGWRGAIEALRSFEGSVHLLVGTDDMLTEPVAVQGWADRAIGGEPRFVRTAVVAGMGHVAPLDHALNDSPLGVAICDATVPVGAIVGPDQHRLVRRFVGATLRSEVLGLADLAAEITDEHFGGTVVHDRDLGRLLVDVELTEGG